jgi:hypothetical protein
MLPILLGLVVKGWKARPPPVKDSESAFARAAHAA